MIRYNTKRYWGYSSDTKPKGAQVGDRFLEIDTKTEYVFGLYNSWNLIGSDAIDSYVTGATLDVPSLTIFQNRTDSFSAITVNLSGLTDNLSNLYLALSGGTMYGDLITPSVSATTYYNLPVDVYVTGGTYSNGSVLFTNNTGGTFTIGGFFTGQTDNNRYITGGTFSYPTGTLSLLDNSGSTINITGFTDVYISGGTYSAGTLTLRNTTGGTFNINGLISANTFTTGATLVGNIAYFNRNDTLSAYTLNLGPYATQYSWGLSGNSGTTSAVNFLGTTDNNGLSIRTNGIERIFINSAGLVNIGGVSGTSGSSKLNIIANGLGTTANTASGITLVNTTTGTTSVPQISPSISWKGNGTNTTGGSESLEFRAYVSPIQGVLNNVTGELIFESAVTGGTFQKQMGISNNFDGRGVKLYGGQFGAGLTMYQGQTASFNQLGFSVLNGTSTIDTSINGFSLNTQSTTRMFISTTGAIAVGGSTSPATSSIFDIASTSKGVLLPRMTKTQRDAIATPASGLTIYNLTTSQMESYNGSSWGGSSNTLYSSNSSITSNRTVDISGRTLTFSSSTSGSTFLVNTNNIKFQPLGGGGSFWNIAEGELRNDIGTTTYISNAPASVGLKTGSGVNGTNRFIVNPDGSTWSLNTSTYNIGGLTNYASAIFSVDSISKGVLLPRLTDAQRNGIATPATSLLIFNTGTGAFNHYNGTTWAEQIHSVNGIANIGTGVHIHTFFDVQTISSEGVIRTTDTKPIVLAVNYQPRIRITNTGVAIGNGVTGITTSAILDIQSTTQGVLLPRMTKTQRDAITGATAGLVIYQTDNTAGLRTYNGTNWMRYTETID